MIGALIAAFLWPWGVLPVASTDLSAQRRSRAVYYVRKPAPREPDTLRTVRTIRIVGTTPPYALPKFTPPRWRLWDERIGQ